MKDKAHQTIFPPRWLVWTIQRMRTFLLGLHTRMFPGNVVLYEQFLYLYLLPSLYVAAELNIAGHLQKGRRSISELAGELQVDPNRLYRVMRALASCGIFRERAGQVFSNNALSAPLLDGSGSLRHVFRCHLSPMNWQIVGDLLETVRTGQDGCSRRFGKNIYEYLIDHPDRYAIFDQSMSELSSLGLSPILQAYSFSGLKTLVDIGGGEGFLLANILKLYPALRGILFDLPEAISGAEDRFREAGVRNRVELREGDFLQSVPEMMDAYLLKNILHNWDETRCVQLLSNICMAMPAHGKVIIIEMVVPPANKSSAAKLIDIQMLASMPGGKERTVEEFSRLLDEAGLSLVKVTSTIAPICILEARRKL